MENDLPRLTDKQSQFLMRYFQNGRNASDAYRYAYNSDAKEKTIWEESSKLLKHPKVTPWVEYYSQNNKENTQKEIEYSVQDCMNELNSLITMAIESKDRQGNPNLSAALKGVELKGKLKSLFKDEAKSSCNLTVKMGEIKAGEQPLTFNIGAENDVDSSGNT